MPAFTVPTHKNKVEVSCYRIPYSPARTYRTVLQMSAPSGKPPMPRRNLPTKDLQNSGNTSVSGLSVLYVFIVKCSYVVRGWETRNWLKAEFRSLGSSSL